MERIAVFRYAKALFEIAVEKNAAQTYNQTAADVLKVLEQDKIVMDMINHPAIPLEEKMKALNTAFSGKVPEDFLGLFELLLRRGRKGEIIGVLRHFDVLYKEYSRLAVAKIYSTEELPANKIAEIKEVLSRKLNKIIEMRTIIDKSLIGGFRVEVDGFVFDASLKHQMERMKKELLGKPF